MWLVTGGCGFIGVNLVKALCERKVAVRVLDDLSSGSLEELRAVAEVAELGSAEAPEPGTVEFLEDDCRNPAAATAAVRGVSTVAHLAAQTGVMPSIEDPRRDCDQNAAGTLNMLLAARNGGVRRFIHASSTSVLGSQSPPVHEQMLPKPLSPYGASKLAAEAYCSAFHASFGLDTVVLRFSNAYGPNSLAKGSVVAAFCRAALAGVPLVIFGDGNQTRDFVHAADLCQAVLKAAAVPAAAGEVFQIATGQETSVAALAAKVRALVAKDLRRSVPAVHEPARKGEIVRNAADISKARRILGYEPAVAMDRGLEETWEWFKAKSRMHDGRPPR